jgi:4-amino-4-deoxy-L-arabinose transferase-like glycosyltransferase
VTSELPLESEVDKGRGGHSQRVLRRAPARRRDAAIAALLAVLTVALLAITDPAIGLTWDEPVYMAAAESYVGWFRLLFSHPAAALRPDAIERYWQVNHEHPPLDKVWSGLVWLAVRPLFSDLTAHRLGNMILAGAIIALLYLLVAREAGLGAGLAAAGALLTMPRFFTHAHLSALDVPGAAGVLGTLAAFWWTRDRQDLRAGLWVGLAWGIAMGLKVNAVVVPIILLLWTLLTSRQLYLFRRLAVLGAVGMLIFLASWPWLYDQFLPRLTEYVRFVTVDHWEIGQYYLGRFYMPPPWHFGFVIVWAVVPLVLSLAALAGTAWSLRTREARPFGALLGLGVLVPVLLPAIGDSFVYDNERLFMPAFPSLAALAGLGLDWFRRSLGALLRRLGARRFGTAVPTLLVAAAYLPHLIAAGSLYPHLLSYYAASVGGLRGATRLGLETTYWCETYAAALPYLNAHAQPGDTVWVEPWSHDVLLYYQVHEQLDPRLRISRLPEAYSLYLDYGLETADVTLEEADYALIQYRQTRFAVYQIPDVLRGRTPAYRLSHRGIPLLDIYAQ